MDNVIGFLVNWTANYLKNRDMITKSILSIKQEDNLVFVQYKYKEQTVIVEGFAESDKLIKKLKINHTSVVLFNTKDNFDFLVNNWPKLAKIKNLRIYFVNPFSQLETKWIIHPFIHSKIADSKSLKTGLKSIFETVEPITKEELYQKI